MNASSQSKIKDTFPTATLIFPAFTQTIPNPEAGGARISEIICGNVEKAAIAGVPQGVTCMTYQDSILTAALQVDHDMEHLWCTRFGLNVLH